MLDNFYPLMTSATVDAGRHGMVHGCVIISIDSSLKSCKEVMYGVVLPPTHYGPIYLDIPFSDVYFPPTVPPMIASLKGTRVFLNAIEGHAMPQNSRQARMLLDLAQ